MSDHTTKKNVHEKHRKRVRENVLKNGFKQLGDHQLLELLLFYSIPRGDTNELAHKLLNEFGGLSGVIKASPEALTKVLTNYPYIYEAIHKTLVRTKRHPLGKIIVTEEDKIAIDSVKAFCSSSEEATKIYSLKEER